MPSDDFWTDLPAKSADQKKSLTKVAPAPTPLAESLPGPSVVNPRTDHIVRRTMLILGTLILMLVCGLGGGALALWQGTQLAVADNSEAGVPIVLDIPSGRTTRQIAQDLVAAKVIVSQWPFLFEVLVTHATLRAGAYVLPPTLTIAGVVQELSAGDVAINRVTIPEGWRLAQMADFLAAKKIATREEFLAAATYDPVRYTLPPGIIRPTGETLEGLLFPDTYEFRLGVTSKEIVETMLKNFATKTHDLHPTYEQVILASIVEREASKAADRPLIAGVYANRLASNLKLEADPTVQYGNDTLRWSNLTKDQKMVWWAPITADDYQRVASPWNTYRIVGLPPTPIASPGLASLQAAVNPTKHANYFFFHRPDGTAVYSKTKAEHDRARAAQ